MNDVRKIELIAIPDVPMVQPGDDLVRIFVEALASTGLAFEDGDVLVVAQKIVSKSENSYVELSSVHPTGHARQLAETSGKDARVIQTVLDESREIIRATPRVLVVEHRNGHVMANAGVDASNIGCGEREMVLKLPEDADRSAAGLRHRLLEVVGREVAVIINDSWGRPWRQGTVGFCLGCAGLVPLWDRRGETDLFGRTLETTEVAIADEMAAAASLLMGAAAEGLPAVIIRGYGRAPGSATAQTLLRARNQDVFR